MRCVRTPSASRVAFEMTASARRIPPASKSAGNHAPAKVHMLGIVYKSRVSRISAKPQPAAVDNFAAAQKLAARRGVHSNA
jgi:hypothetical protein